MNHWDNYLFFLTLARCSSLKDSAKILQTDATTVARRISALERSLKVKLFEKHSDGFMLTAAGRAILDETIAIEEISTSISRKIGGLDKRLEGKVRIAAPGALANHLIIPQFSDFMKDHPDIQLDFLTGPEVVNLAKREADIAVRLVRPRQQELKFSIIGRMKLGLYVHKNLIEKSSTPLNQIRNLKMIALDTSAMSEAEKKMRASIYVPIKVGMITKAWSSVYYALKGKLGFGILPDFLAKQESQLFLIDEVKQIESSIFMVTHPDLDHNASIKAVSNNIKKIIENHSL